MTALLEADDLFAGAGGWDLAAAALGIHARGVEIMPAARATREAAGLTTIHDDVWTFKPHYLGRKLKVTGLIASPPCPTFSTAGKGAGRKATPVIQQLAPHVGSYRLKQLRRIAVRATGDERTALVLVPLWFAVHHPYQWLAWEQVPAVLPIWEACSGVLRERGWHVWTGILHAEQYGVPQTRQRALLIASRLGLVSPPRPTHSRYHRSTPDRLDPGVAKWVSMAEAMGWGWTAQPAHAVTSGGGDGRSVWADKGVRARMETAAATGRQWKRSPRVLAQAGTSSTIVDPRPVTHPAATITGAGNAEWGQRIGRAPGPGQRDPDGIRLIPSEAGVLQGFPADYPWQGAQGKQFLQAGNAVPPGLARHALSAAAVHHLAHLAEEVAS